VFNFLLPISLLYLLSLEKKIIKESILEVRRFYLIIIFPEIDLLKWKPLE
jgi:hypothetical protein